MASLERDLGRRPPPGLIKPNDPLSARLFELCAHYSSWIAIPYARPAGIVVMALVVVATL